MNFSQLKTFVCVRRMGSIGRAAKALGLTQPAVTLHIQKLEREIGGTLFERKGPVCQPTLAGEKLYSKATAILKTCDEISEELSFLSREVHGKIRIAASTTPGEFLVPRLASQFIKKYPQATVEVSITDTRKAVECLREKHCDFAFVGAMIKNTSFTYKKIMDDEIVLAVPGQHPDAGRNTISIHELENKKLVMREEGSGTMKTVFELLMKSGTPLPKNVSVAGIFGSTQALLYAVEAGLGAGFVSSLALSATKRPVKATRLKETPLFRSLYIAYDKKHLKTRLLKEFCRFAVLARL